MCVFLDAIARFLFTQTGARVSQAVSLTWLEVVEVDPFRVREEASNPLAEVEDLRAAVPGAAHTPEAVEGNIALAHICGPRADRRSGVADKRRVQRAERAAGSLAAYADRRPDALRFPAGIPVAPRRVSAPLRARPRRSAARKPPSC
jgi:hypothetical protein